MHYLLFIFNVSAWFWQVKGAASDAGKSVATAEVDVHREDRKEGRGTNMSPFNATKDHITSLQRHWVGI